MLSRDWGSDPHLPRPAMSSESRGASARPPLSLESERPPLGTPGCGSSPVRVAAPRSFWGHRSPLGSPGPDLRARAGREGSRTSAVCAMGASAWRKRCTDLSVCRPRRPPLQTPPSVLRQSSLTPAALRWELSGGGARNAGFGELPLETHPPSVHNALDACERRSPPPLRLRVRDGSPAARAVP